MGFIFAPAAQGRGAGAPAGDHVARPSASCEHALPFAMEPVVYDFAINERGTCADLLAGDAALMPPGYYTLTVPALLRAGPPHAARRCAAPSWTSSAPPAAPGPSCAGMVQTLFDRHAAARQGGERPPAQTLAALLERARLRPRAARADPRRPARGPHRPGAEPPARQRGHRGRAGRRRGRSRRAGRGRRRCDAAGPGGACRAARWPWSRWPPAPAAAGRRARAWSRRCIRSASSAAGTAPSSRSTWPRAAASARAVRHAAAAHHHHQLPDPRADRGVPGARRATTATPARCSCRPAARSACA